MQEITKEREVLFQKLGAKWYAFSEIDNDVVYSVLPDGIDPRTTKLEMYDIIEKHLERVSQYKKKHYTEAVA